jgi:hypothetical protein
MIYCMCGIGIFVDPLWCGVRCRPLTKELMEVYYLYLYESCI